MMEREPSAIEAIQDLPEGWTAAVLQDLVAEAIGGDWGYPPTEANGRDRIAVSVIRGTEFKDWDSQRGSSAACRAVDSKKLARRQLHAGDLVLEVSGGGPHQSVGRTALIDEQTLAAAKLPLICSNFCRRLSLCSAVTPEYVWWALRWLYSCGDFEQFQTQTTNLRNLNVGDFLGGVELPVPPLAEQKRIVAKVEELLGRVNAARARLAKAPAILKRFRQSVLAAACSGQLTADWREANRPTEPGAALLQRLLMLRQDKWGSFMRTAYKPPVAPDPDDPPEHPEGWAIASMDQLTVVITSGSRDWSRYYGRGTGTFIMAQNIRPGFLHLSNRQPVDPPANDRDRARSQVLKGDLLVTIVGANTGDVCPVARDLPEHYVCQSVAMMRPTDVALARYLNLYLNSAAHGRGRYDQYIYGEGRPHLSFDHLRMTPVALAPLDEQREIVRRVDALFAFADKIEARVQAATTRVEKITQAILAKAFRGELVPTEADLARAEGRSYEPAAALLARIRAERATESKAEQKLARRVRASAGGGRTKARPTQR